ncbi:MAG TPA: pyridoxal kinase PdxY [Spirochaetales bacterium]|nr:pyridoxal kinase PdxY [Spirochaetales bacterium]HRY55902.1 pyridoxal kinase PdxY [Spirochaetia bacterium]HRZ64375.1 pyridoxal kinase PdxY [Spirochaetia bacterium]
MAILSIQSHVAYGHVGNRAAVFPLERLGYEVWPINTVQFSNHTGYGSWKGEVFTSAHIELVWSGVKDRGALASCEAVLSGYMGAAEIGTAVLGAVDDVRKANPEAIYCCDPVMGDYGRGFFVGEGIPGFIETRAARWADIITPNQFEAEALSGGVISDLESAKRAAESIHELGPRIVLITSFEPSGGSGSEISMFLSDGKEFRTVTTPRLPLDPAPNGAGDLCAALFLGRYLETRDPAESLELMTDSVFAILERSLADGSRELRLVQAQEAIARPERRFSSRRV